MTTPKANNCHPVLLLLDEAGTVGLPSLPQYVATVAGRGMSVWAAYQDLSQPDGLYGIHKAKTIRNNMDTKIYYRQASDETAEHIERALGRAPGTPTRKPFARDKRPVSRWVSRPSPC